MGSLRSIHLVASALAPSPQQPLDVLLSVAWLFVIVLVVSVSSPNLLRPSPVKASAS